MEITEKQLALLNKLLAKYERPITVPIESLTKRQASELISFLLDTKSPDIESYPNLSVLFTPMVMDDEEKLPF